ncbi:MAG: hypothetical protein ACLPKB_32570 [Xanthobacteraceae bacterium]
MAEDTEGRTPKTKTLGYLPMDKAKKLKGWDDYERKASKFSEAKSEAETAKEVVRSAIRPKFKNADGDIDFTPEGNRIKVVAKLEKKGRRTKTRDLSDLF